MQMIQRLQTRHFTIRAAGKGDFWLKAHSSEGKAILRHKRIATLKGQALIGSERLMAFIGELERKANILKSL